MTQTTQSQISAGAVASPDATERPGSIDSGLDRLWHFLTSMKLALVRGSPSRALTLSGRWSSVRRRAMDDRVAGAVAGWTAASVLGLADVLDRLQVFTIFTSVRSAISPVTLLIACTRSGSARVTERRT
jgi:hypothetical protein